MRPLVFFGLLLTLAACSAPPAALPEGALELTRYQGLGLDLSPLAAVYERLAVRVPLDQGLKVWLEVDGEVVAQLGFRHEWATVALPFREERLFERMDEGAWLDYGGKTEHPHDTAWIHFRELSLNGLASPHCNVELMLASGWQEEDERYWLRDAQAQGISYAVPADPRARRKLLQAVPLGQPTTQELRELSSSKVWGSTLWLELNTPLAVASFPSTQDVRLWVELVAPGA